MRFIFLVGFLLFNSCYQPNRDCNAFKIGEFYSEVYVNGQTYKSLFVRTDAIQVETYNEKTDSSYVRWINECEVIFKTIHPKNRIEKKDIHLKILTTTDSSYTFEYSYVGETKKQKGTAYRIN